MDLILPEDLILEIIQYLDINSFLHFITTSKSHYSFRYKEHIWTNYAEKNFKYPKQTFRDFTFKCGYLKYSLLNLHRNRFRNGFSLFCSIEDYEFIKAGVKISITKDTLLESVKCDNIALFKVLLHSEFNPNIDRNFELWHFFSILIERGCTSDVKYINSIFEFDPQFIIGKLCRDTYCVYKIVLTGNLEVLKLIVKLESLCLAKINLVDLAVKYYQIDILNYVLEEPLLRSHLNKTPACYTVYRNRRWDILKLLLQNPYINISINNNALINECIRQYDHKITNRCLKHPRFDPNNGNLNILEAASCVNEISIVSHILKLKNINWEIENQERDLHLWRSLYRAIEYQHYDMALILIQFPYINPMPKSELEFGFIHKYNLIDTIVNHPYIIKHGKYWSIFKNAMIIPDITIMKTLLQDKSIVLNTKKITPKLIKYCVKLYPEIRELLIQDDRFIDLLS